MNRDRSKCFVLYFALLIISVSCERRSEKGFILFIDPDHWFFVPATNLSEENYLDEFNSNNLGYGTQFRPFFKGKSEILMNLDTITIDSFRSDLAPHYSTLKITPVRIKYDIADEKIPSSSIFKFSCKIRGEEVKFSFNTLPINIKAIDPM